MKLYLRSMLPGALAAAALLASTSAQADTFNLAPITINTSPLSGTSGYLEFVYTANSDGTTPIAGSVSVTSPTVGSFNLDNSSYYSYQLDPYTFGNTFTFTPTFTTTPTPGADEGNAFYLFALDNTYTPFSTSDPSGLDSVLAVYQNTDGTVSKPEVYSPFTQIAPVPEASTFTLFTLLLLGAGVLVYRRRRRVEA